MKKYLIVLFSQLVLFNQLSRAQTSDSLSVTVDSVKTENVADEIFTIVEDPAEPPNGYSSFYKFISDNLRYPVEALRTGTKGKVYAQFVIDTSGKLTDIMIVKGIGAGCDEEVERVLGLSELWKPAFQRGVAVKQRIILPVTFNMEIADKGYKPVKHESASFPGGENELADFVERNLNEFSDSIPANKSNNRVLVGFKVTEKGIITEIKIEEGLGDPFDQEALRVVGLMPNWNPSKRDDEEVADLVKLYFNFNNIDPKNIKKANSLFENAMRSYYAGKLMKASELFNEAKSYNHTVLDYYYNRAVILIEMDSILQGCKELKQIIENDALAKDTYIANCLEAEKYLGSNNSDSELFQIVETAAEPNGGYSVFYDFINSNLKYPREARRMGVEGKVMVEFVVYQDGSLNEVLVFKGIGAGCDEEAIRLINLAPNWSPPLQKGKPVKQRIRLPITFKLF